MPRAQVLALIAGSAMSMRAPRLDAATPLRSLPPVLEAKLAARADAGLVPLGADHPRRGLWGRVVLPSAAFAGLDAVGIGVGAAAGHTVLAIFAGVLFIPFAGIAGAGARFAGRDPLRFTAADRRQVSAASRWESGQEWTGALAGGAERGLVIAATVAGERIARSPTWRSGRIDELRIQLDLAHELDQIDDQAHRIALARRAQGPSTPGRAPVVDAAWDAAVDRVAALTAYADQIDGWEQRRIDALTRQGDPVRDSELLAGSTLDDMAVEQLTALMLVLGPSMDLDL
jgi:hypothetical protein